MLGDVAVPGKTRHTKSRTPPQLGIGLAVGIEAIADFGHRRPHAANARITSFQTALTWFDVSRAIDGDAVADFSATLQIPAKGCGKTLACAEI